MRAYSLDLRQRVVRAYEEGYLSVAEVAEQFSVGTGFVKKMPRQWRSTGDLAPKPHGGGKPTSLSAQVRQKLGRRVRAQGDITLTALQDFLLAGEQKSVHVATISRRSKNSACRVKKEFSGGRAQQLQARMVPAAHT